MTAPSRTPLVFELTEATGRDDVGSKAMVLARLAHLGYAVPPGFVISWRAFERYRDRVVSSGGAPAELDADLVAQLRLALRTLGGAVAVRSAGDQEDSLGASYAGAFLTRLNVIDDAGLVQAVRDCWDAALNEKNGMRVSLLVQRMVAAESAGVLFTRSPEYDGDCLIESAWGLGVTAVGGGAVDRAIVSRDATQVRVEVTNKPDRADPEEGGGVVRRACLPELASAGSLNEADALRLARLGLRIEEHLGFPVDVEWALLDGTLHVLQARPVVSPDRWADPPPAHPFDLWSRVHVSELFPDPVTPFTWSLASAHWSEIRRGYFRELGVRDIDSIAFFRLYEHKLYFNVGALYYLRSERLGRPTQKLAPHATSSEPPERHGLQARRGDLWRMTRGMPALLKRAVTSSITMRGARLEFERAAETARRYRKQPHDGPSAELWDRFQLIWDEVRRLEIIEGTVDETVFAASRRLEILCHRWLGDQTLMAELLGDAPTEERSIIGNDLLAVAGGANDELRAAIADRPIAQLVDEYRSGAPWAASLESFLERHGHRARGELEWAQARWVEDPTPVLAALRTYLRAGASRSTARPRAPSTARGIALERIAALPGERWLPWRGLLFGFALRQACAAVGLRSLPRDKVMLLALESRRLLTTIGARLARAGAIASPDDLFYLTVPEIKRTLDSPTPISWHAAVSRRRRLLERSRAFQEPEALGADGHADSTAEARDAAAPANHTTLHGRAGAPGQARGKVRIMRSAEDAERVRPGEVLVLATSDIGSTLLFPLAAGLVIERGGLLSHAMVLAREFGLPAVAECRDAARHLRDGQLVEVDGSHGRVNILDRVEGETSGV
jgi:pyruvate,water dikinase